MNEIDPKTLLIKRLLYQSKNRGCKETDLLLGRFAEEFLRNMNDEELEDFSYIIKQNDSDIYDWVTLKSPPPNITSNIMNLLVQFSLTK